MVKKTYELVLPIIDHQKKCKSKPQQYRHTPAEWPKSKRRATSSVSEDDEQQNSAAPLVGALRQCSHFGKPHGGHAPNKQSRSTQLSDSTPTQTPYGSAGGDVFIGMLVVMVKNWKQPKHPPAEEKTHKPKHYTSVRTNKP